MADDPIPRWAYRFDNYRRAYGLLSEALDAAEERELSQLEQEGVIQRFEYTWELAWSVLADDLAEQGLPPVPRTPAKTIRLAATAGLIDDPEAWMLALDSRNKLSHVYSFAVFARVIGDLRAKFRPLFAKLFEHYAARRLEL